MLNYIRKQSDSWLIKSVLWGIVIAFVATIFYSWGVGGPTGGRSGTLATVQGQEIHLAEYDLYYNNLVNFYRDQLKGQFSEEIIKNLDLKNSALDALIQKKLLLLEAEKQEIHVSDKELADRIITIPMFQKDNVFNKTYYQSFLTQNRLTTHKFEESQREKMVLEKIEQLIKNNTQVSETEIQEAFKKEQEKIKFRYVEFSKDHFKAPPPTDENLRKYFEANQKQFEIPEQIKVEYVKLTPKSLENSIDIRDDDIEDYYENQKGEFFVKKQFTASHILIRSDSLPPSDGLSDSEKEKILDDLDGKTKAKAEEILKKIRAGADFAEMARKHSDDTISGANGGSLGQFSQGTMVPEFETALGKLTAGEIGEPVKTVFGYHLIKLDKVEEERTKPLAEVKEEITNTLKAMKSRQRARRTIKKIYKDAKTDNNLIRAALKFKTETTLSELFSRKNHDLTEIGVVPEFFNTAFSLRDQEVSFPVNTHEASYLIKIIERKSPQLPKLEDVRSAVTEEVVLQKTSSLTLEKFNVLTQRLNTQKDLAIIAAELGLEVEETPLFSLVDSIPGIGNIQAIKDSVSQLSLDQTTGASSRLSYFLIQLVERKTAGAPTPDQTQDLYARLKEEKSIHVFQEWLEDLKEKADIMVDKTLL